MREFSDRQFPSPKRLPAPTEGEEVAFEFVVIKSMLRERDGHWFVRAVCTIGDGDAVTVGQWGPFLGEPQIHGVDFT